MKKNVLFCAGAALAILAGGCSSDNLGEGCYQCNVAGRSDCAWVYQDLIFLNIKAPANIPAREEYWRWAGKYSIDKQGNIVFDMDSDTRRRWSFSYSFVAKQGGIIVNDWESNTGLVLHYSVPKLRPSTEEKIPNSMPIEAEQNLTPTYQPMPAR